MCILWVCTLLKVVSHYGLSVLSMLVMGFQKQTLDSGVFVCDDSLVVLCPNYGLPGKIVTKPYVVSKEAQLYSL